LTAEFDGFAGSNCTNDVTFDDVKYAIRGYDICDQVETILNGSLNDSSSSFARVVMMVMDVMDNDSGDAADLPFEHEWLFFDG